MKKMYFILAACIVSHGMEAQVKEGVVIYERTVQMQMMINDNDQMAQMMPKTHTDRFELSFGNNQSLWKHVDEENVADEVSGGGMRINIIGDKQDDITWCNFDIARRVEQRSMFDKKFLVEDTIKKLNWKITGTTKTILGHLCQQATTQRLGKRAMMNMDNGKMVRKEFDDTTSISAWFSTDLPISAGPEVPGQLPGLVLALDINNGRTVYIAKEISPKVNLTVIKEPTKGKKVTPDEFRSETQKMMQEMEKNNSGNRHFRVSN